MVFIIRIKCVAVDSSEIGFQMIDIHLMIIGVQDIDIAVMIGNEEQFTVSIIKNLPDIIIRE